MKKQAKKLFMELGACIIFLVFITLAIGLLGCETTQTQQVDLSNIESRLSELEQNTQIVDEEILETQVNEIMTASSYWASISGGIINNSRQIQILSNELDSKLDSISDLQASIDIQQSQGINSLSENISYIRQRDSIKDKILLNKTELIQNQLNIITQQIDSIIKQ